MSRAPGKLHRMAHALVTALVRGEEVTIAAGTQEQAQELYEHARKMIDDGDPTFTPEELERARALMEVERDPGTRGVRTDGLIPDSDEELDDVIEALPLANGGPCVGDKCTRSSKGRRRAVWVILDKELCDRCATRYARELDGGPTMAIPRGR